MTTKTTRSMLLPCLLLMLAAGVCAHAQSTVFSAPSTDVLAHGQPLEIQPTLKWQFYADEERGTQAADWLTGRNRFGYFSPGFALSLSRRSTLFTGYSFGNSGRGNNALVINFGHAF